MLGPALDVAMLCKPFAERVGGCKVQPSLVPREEAGTPASSRTDLLGLMSPQCSLERCLSFVAFCASLLLLDPVELPAGIHMQSYSGQILSRHTFICP